MDEADALADLLGKGAGAPPAADLPPPPVGREATIRLYLLIVAGLVLAGVWIYCAARGVEWAMGSGWFGSALGDMEIDALANLIIFGGLLAVTGLMVHIAPVDVPTYRLSAGLGLAIGLPLGILGLFLSFAQAWVGGHVQLANGSVATGVTALLIGSMMTLFEAAVEELFFRGWLQARLVSLIGRTGAVAAAAIAFSLLHIFGGARSSISLINIFLAGLFFGVLFLRTGSIFSSIGAHFGWNWAETMLFGLSPNPGAPVYGAIFNFDLVGSGRWGGSDEGMNAAVAVTLVLAALILPCLAFEMHDQPA